MKYSDTVNSLRKRSKVLVEMLEKTRNIPTFQYGDLEGEWEAVCKKVSADWKAQLTALEMLSMEYQAAISRFENTYNLLLNARNEMRRMGKIDGLELVTRPILSIGVDVEKICIPKDLCYRINSLLERSAVFGDRDLL